MEANAKRRLVKSAPELWEIASDRQRMEAWTAELVGSAEPVPVEVTGSDCERALRWRSAGPRTEAQIEIELTDSGFGTGVEITAHHPGADPVDARSTLESVLDELAAPERRPFTAA